jgi:hypothetical protein
MNQQLTLNKSIIKFFAENLPAYSVNDAIKIIDLIEQNRIISDFEKKYFIELDNEIDTISDLTKRFEIRKIFDNWINYRCSFINYSFDSENEGDVQLAFHSEDRIYFNPYLIEKQKSKLEIKYSGIEVHNKDSFLEPEYFQRLKHLPTAVRLNDGLPYDLAAIINPFIKEAKRIIVIDPYLPNENASRNLFNLFDLLIGKEITLVFLSEKKYTAIQIKKNGIFEEIIDKIKLKLYNDFLNNLENKRLDGFKINMEHFHEKKHIERHILTEEVQINLPGGLDFLNIDGKPNLISSALKEYDIKEISIKGRIKKTK